MSINVIIIVNNNTIIIINININIIVNINIIIIININIIGSSPLSPNLSLYMPVGEHYLFLTHLCHIGYLYHPSSKIWSSRM